MTVSLVQELGRLWPVSLTSTSICRRLQMWCPDQGSWLTFFFLKRNVEEIGRGSSDYVVSLLGDVRCQSRASAQVTSCPASLREGGLLSSGNFLCWHGYILRTWSWHGLGVRGTMGRGQVIQGTQGTQSPGLTQPTLL